MKLELPAMRPEDRTPLVESLLARLRQLLDRVQQREETVQQVRDEIAIRKGQKPRPEIRPSTRASTTAALPPQEGQRPGSAKRAKNSHRCIPEDVVLLPDHLPPGAVFKG